MRLRNPWERAPSSSAAQLRFVRRFGRPTNLEPHERVHMVLEQLAADSTIALNDQPLGRCAAGDTFRFEITPQLAARNEIAVEVASSSTRHQSDEPGGRTEFVGRMVGDVRLEIS